ncbi:hypothetical protein [Haloarcula sp. H-GB5]
MAHNVRHDDDTYHRRSIVEAVVFALKERGYILLAEVVGSRPA